AIVFVRVRASVQIWIERNAVGAEHAGGIAPVGEAIEHTVVFDFVPVGGKFQIPGIVDAVTQTEAHKIVALQIGGILVEREVPAVAVVASVMRRQAHGEIVGSRNIEHAGDFTRIELRDAGRDTAFEFINGLIGDDAERAADGIAAEHSALRTAQDFYALDIVEIHHAGGGARHIDAIDINADSRIIADARLQILLTAQCDKYELRAGGGAGRNAEVWRRALNIGDVDDLFQFQPSRAGRSDCDRRRLQVLIAAARGDHYFLYHIGAWLRIHILGKWRKYQRCRQTVDSV